MSPCPARQLPQRKASWRSQLCIDLRISRKPLALYRPPHPSLPSLLPFSLFPPSQPLPILPPRHRPSIRLKKMLGISRHIMGSLEGPCFLTPSHLPPTPPSKSHSFSSTFQCPRLLPALKTTPACFLPLNTSAGCRPGVGEHSEPKDCFVHGCCYAGCWGRLRCHCSLRPHRFVLGNHDRSRHSLQSTSTQLG